jgi:membrane associated rhomboid family serine protease
VVHSAPLTPAASTPDRAVQRQKVQYNGVMLLLLLNVLVFAADAWVPGINVKHLYLHHAHPRWWQFLTSAFCHANFEHLNGNLFMLLVFGKAVEQEEGFAGVWLSYILCGIGASIASYLLMPSSTGGLLGGSSVVSLGASGAVFGLFSISVLVKLTADWRKLLESAILGSFVVDKVWNEVAITASGAATGGVNHVAHLAGALCGVLLIWALQNAFPKQQEGATE